MDADLADRPISQPRARPPRDPRGPLAAGLLALAVSTYLPVTRHDFVTYDDPPYVTRNEVVQRGLTWRGMQWAFTTGHVSNWHPLTWLSHMLDVELFGLWAGGHHLGNLVLHAANTLLVFLAFDRLARAGWAWLGASDDERRRLPWRAALVAALFAVHPLHVESVAWVAERKDTLSTLFGLGAMCLYAAYAERPSPGRYLGVALLMAMGLLSKPMLVTLPCVLLLLDYWPLGRWQPRWAIDPRGQTLRAPWPAWKLAAEKLPLLALTVASSLQTMLVQRSGGALKSEALYPLDCRIWNAIYSYARYLLHTVAPCDLTFFYPYPSRGMLGRGAGDPRLLGSLLFLALVTALCLWFGRRYRYLAVGWMWYLGTLAPVIGLVQVGDQAMADRYTYVPLLGIFVIAAWGAPDLLDGLVRGATPRRRGEAGLLALAGTLVAACAALTLRQQSHWADSVTLYRYGISVNPGNYVAHNNLALLLSEQGQHEQALQHHRAAVEAYPRYVVGHFNLGVELEAVQQFDEAARHYREALHYNPRYTKARHNLAAALARQGRLHEALPHARQAVDESPRLAMPARTHGTILLRLGRAEEALVQFDNALALEPRSAEAHAGRGLALLRLGRDDDARAALSQALALRPDYPEPHLGLGDLAAQGGHARLAEFHYQLALRFRPAAAEAARKLAELAAADSRPGDAASWYARSVLNDPYDPDVREAYARVLEGLGRLQEAEAERLEASTLRSSQLE